MRDLMAATQALSDENRVRILACLRGGELCVCQINELLDLAPSTISKHLFILRHACLIECRKDGRWVYYRLADSDASRVVRDALRWVMGSLAGDERIAEDARRLKQVLQIMPEVLCSQQRGITKRHVAKARRSSCSSCAPAMRAAARWPKGGRVTSRAT